MSLNKAIENNKTRRKQYEDGRQYLISYRNHKANSLARYKRDMRLQRNKGMYIESED